MIITELPKRVTLNSARKQTRKRRSVITAPRRQVNNLTLGQLRNEVARLREKHSDYATISRALGITAIKARDLYRQHERITSQYSVGSPQYELSRRAILAIITCSHAPAFGTSVEERIARLLDIASNLTRDELLGEQDIGRVTVKEIEIWLTSKGRTFCQPRSESAEIYPSVSITPQSRQMQSRYQLQAADAGR
jgi:hypothetical protein